MIGEADVTEAEVTQIFSVIDEDGDGSINYDEISRVGQLNQDIKSLSRKVVTLETAVRSFQRQLGPHRQQRLQQQEGAEGFRSTEERKTVNAASSSPMEAATGQSIDALADTPAMLEHVADDLSLLSTTAPAKDGPKLQRGDAGVDAETQDNLEM